MLHDGIEDASESHSSIAERFDVAVDDMVHDCTDTSPNTQPSEKTLVAAQIPLHHFLAGKSISLLLVTAADKAHNAREMVLDSQRRNSMHNARRYLLVPGSIGIDLVLVQIYPIN